MSQLNQDQLTSIRLAQEDQPSLPQIPSRSNAGTPLPSNAIRAPSTSQAASLRATSFAYGSPRQQHRPSIEHVTEEEKAAIVRRHLANSKTPDDSSVFEEDGPADRLTRTPSPLPDAKQPQTYHNLLGGDVTHDLFKYASDVESRQTQRPRSRSFTEGQTTPSVRRASMANGAGMDDISSAQEAEADLESGLNTDPTLDMKGIRAPGGFRRNYIHRQAQTQRGGESPSPDRRPRLTRSFVDFLSLYGHFGGEFLEEIEEGDETEPYSSEDDGADQDLGAEEISAGQKRSSDERTPLFIRQRSKSRDMRAESKRSLLRSESKLSRRRSQSAAGRHGNATVFQSVLMIVKGFVGTGILFLGKAFFNGGLLFSVIAIISIALISLYSFLLLVDTRLVIPGSFGDMGDILYGKFMRLAILASIALSQIGFVSAYTIFVAENLQAFFMAVTHKSLDLPIEIYIFVQLIILLPLAMIRDIQKLSGTALVADVFILIGLVYIFGNEIAVISHRGIADVALFNPKSYALLIGTAVFSFEGIGLIIPITESMREPQKFPRVLTYCMFGLLALFAGGGALAYMAYGSSIKTVVLVNLPQDDKMVNAVQFLYCVAIMLSTPLQLFPAVRIMENGLFSSSGKHNTQVKWEKNIFRSLVVLLCVMIAWLGANDLDKFVSIVGSVACVPLCYCYPALLHLKACAKTRWQVFCDVALLVFGVVACIFCSVQTIQQLVEAGSQSPA